MRTIIVACVLALAACGKPAEEKKTEARDTPAPPSTPAPVQVTPPPPSAPAPAPGAPLTAEEKAKAVTTIEAKIVVVDEAAAKVTENMKTAASEAEREQLVKKLEHLVEEKAALRKQLESYGAR
jgi:hypothetical protein